MLIDTHIHFCCPEFDKDREEVIERARQNGISYMINVGDDLTSSNYAVVLAQGYDCIFAMVGIHPHNAFQIDKQTYNSLINLAQKNKVVAIGEIGLDYHYNFSLPAIQKKVFRHQINLAKEMNLPIAVHSRKADEDVLKILLQEKASKVRGVLHCFSGSIEIAKRYIEIGFYIGITGLITFKNALSLQDTVKKLPLESILVETDSPYLAPYPFRGKRNEPAFLPHIIEKMAEIKEINPEEIYRQTSQNAIELFRLKDYIFKERRCQ